MNWQDSPYVLPLLLTSFVSLSLAIYLFWHRQLDSAPPLMLLLLAVSIWVFTYAFELGATTKEEKILWAKVAYLGIVTIPVFYTFFILKFTDQFALLKYPRQSANSLFVIPVIVLFLVWTNESHHLIWTNIELVLYQGNSYLAFEHGFGFWVNIAYAYVILSVSTILLLRKIIVSPSLLRGQISMLILGTLGPWVGNFLYISNVNPFPHLDLAPFTFVFTSIFFSLAVFRFKFLDLVPVARQVVVEQLEIGFLVIDGQNRVIDLNKATEIILEINKKAALHNPLSLDHLDPKALAPLRLILQEMLSGKVELPIGNDHYEASVVLFENGNARANGRLITLHNITQRKETEHLLQQAKEAAEAAEQAKTNFLTNMSHEIRTPLNAVVGMAEMLRQTNPNPNQQEMIDIVAQSSNNLVNLVNNILDFAKLESGDLKLKQQSFDLIDCVEAALDSVSQAAHEKQLRLHYNIEEQMPTQLIGDPVRLRQVLINLLENGIKFTEEGQITVGIRHTAVNDIITLHFTVEDNGIGIAAEQIPQLFLPFSQVDDSLTRTHGGTGIGLVICKRLVTLMSGDIQLHSTVGEGTAVHFSADFSLATDDQLPTVTLRHHKATLANKRLLVVTNDAIQRRQISKEGRIAGLEVYAAGSSQEAVYWITHSEPFDVVLLETAVWQADPAIVPQLRNSKTRQPFPIILLNPEGEEIPLAATHEAFAGNLTLPVVSSQLYDKLLNVMSVKTASATSQESGKTMGDRYPLNILLVEDNKLNRRVLQNMLSKLGYQADSAANGLIGLQATTKRDYDVILMDIQMPVMDGIEATNQILANCSLEKRPYIIAVTAHAMEGDREHYLSLGMNAYISKPVKLNQLVEALYQRINCTETTTLSPTQVAEQLTDLIDLEELARLVGDNTEPFLKMMAPIFLEDSGKILANLATAVQNKDCTGIIHATHTLKGSSASMAMTQLTAYSRKLETMAKAGNLAEAQPTLAQIQAEYGRIQTVLAKMVHPAKVEDALAEA